MNKSINKWSLDYIKKIYVALHINIPREVQCFTSLMWVSVNYWYGKGMFYLMSGWASLHPGHLQGPVCQKGPSNHWGPQPPQPETVWATAVREAVPKPKGQNPEDDKQFFSPSSQAPWETHFPQTIRTHTTTTDWYLTTYLSIAFAQHLFIAQ